MRPTRRFGPPNVGLDDRARGAWCPRHRRRTRRHHARLARRIDQADRSSEGRVTMKRIFDTCSRSSSCCSILGSFVFLYKKSQAKPVVYQTESAEITDIAQEDGRDRLDRAAPVRRGEAEGHRRAQRALRRRRRGREEGQPLGKVQIIADAQALNSARGAAATAQITLDNAKRELDREEGLFKQGVVAEQELYKFRTDYALAKEGVDDRAARTCSSSRKARPAARARRRRRSSPRRSTAWSSTCR